MISKSKELYEKIHLNSQEEKPSSDDENAFINKFSYEALPMFIIKPERQPSPQ